MLQLIEFTFKKLIFCLKNKIWELCRGESVIENEGKADKKKEKVSEFKSIELQFYMKDLPFE